MGASVPHAAAAPPPPPGPYNSDDDGLKGMGMGWADRVLQFYEP